MNKGVLGTAWRATARIWMLGTALVLLFGSAVYAQSIDCNLWKEPVGGPRQFWTRTPFEEIRSCFDRNSINERTGTMSSATVLHSAASVGASSEVIEMLLSLGAEIDARNAYGDTPIMHASRSNLNGDSVEVLIRNGANLNLRNQDGETALHIMLHNNMRASTVRIMISAGANIDARDDHGRTPLFQLTQTEESIRLLVSSGANINARDNEGNTPLHHYARWGRAFHSGLVLISEGADISARNSSGQMPIDVADEHDRREELGADFYWAINEARY